MGGSDAAPAARDDAQVVVVVGSPVDGSPAPAPSDPPLAASAPASTPPAPAPAAAEAEAKRDLPAAAAAAPAENLAVEGKQVEAASAAQAMAVTVVRDIEAGPEASTSGFAEEKPSWFTPKRLLVMFCIINMLNYVDRGVIASNGVNGSRGSCSGGTCSSGSGIQGDFNLSNFEDGVLSSAFMVGLLVASPIFASLAKIHNPFRLIGVGLLVWTIATAGCGCSFDFWSITICRMLVGVGEASFISLAAPFIDDNAPAAQKTAWLAMFYMCIPTGIALGYVYGGLVGGHLHWRAAFWGESILMLPFVILGFVIKPLELKGFTHNKKTKEYGPMLSPELQDETSNNGIKQGVPAIVEGLAEKLPEKSSLSSFGKKVMIEIHHFGKDMKELLQERVYVVNVAGYIFYNFVIGAYSYWGPKAGQDIYHMASADLMFGGITIVCGIFGTLAGGFILDKIDSTISNAFKLLSGATFLGAIFCFGAFCFKSLYGFIPFFSVGELLVFATQAPVNYICLHSVKPSLRPLSMAMSTVSIHILGDVPSSPIVGFIQDKIHNWRTTALLLTSILIGAFVCWFCGIFLHSVDRFNEESEHGVPATERSNLRPLLDDGNDEARTSQ
ncbi:probable sphingolipid transporter spinster homolog 2 [Aegilops tauschii subsp. strangulata]|uniref:Major facilitator superfamily (MFS) profile domain-containing protein n=3 Tax=Triticinae TaxID=1648030 RepID=A0A453CGW2_AEGTS|nr:probable sphingolipid transporter spinster homolog 2 [Aegilops tauschii subsp. strangulata]XP_044333509.1 probable sphingolipid transporter spinster homolog 2 [Triticum aestivum]